ncbi:hypothetical protein ACS0TY_019022 [Phlomoides rotata]
MAPLTRSILFTFLLVLVFALSILGPVVGRFGTWEPINDPNAPEIVNIAKFAVEKHNKDDGTSLVFKKLVKAELQNAPYINYRLTISTTDGSAAPPKTYQAIIYSKPEDHVLILTIFVLLHV